MHKFFLPLILLSVPISTSALAHSGTEQDEKACAPVVHRFCRNLLDQGDFHHSGLPQGKPSKALCRVPLRADQPRAMTIGVLFGAGALPSLNRGFGDLEIRWSGLSPFGKADRRTASGA
jgi:hypothetical protein